VINLDERHPHYKNYTRRQISDMRRKPHGRVYPLQNIEQRSDGWYAVYGDGTEYRHNTEAEVRKFHRWD
jgi:hypothetical protein